MRHRSEALGRASRGDALLVNAAWPFPRSSISGSPEKYPKLRYPQIAELSRIRNRRRRRGFDWRHNWEVSDEQAFILGHDCRGRARDFGVRAVFSEHVELHSVRDAATEGLHPDAVLFDVDTVEFVGFNSDQSFEQLDSDPVSIVDRPDRR